MADKRIYLVAPSTPKDGAPPSALGERLIRATNVAQARNHAARETFAVNVASQDDLVRLLGTVKVENAGETDEKA